MKRRATKRIRNRLAKKGFTFLRWEQADPHLVCMRAIVETRCKQRSARSFAFPTEWLKTCGARAVADSILFDFARLRGQNRNVIQGNQT